MFSEVSSIDTNEYEHLTSLPEPTRSGYTFKGWFLDDETFLKDVNTSTTFAEDTTLYAKW